MSYQLGPQPCRHCRRNTGDPRRRHLCRGCHDDPAIRRRYPRSDPHGRRYPADGDGSGPAAGRPLPARPTDAPPGSEAKVLVLLERATQRRQLWHPDDARMDAEGEAAAPWLRLYATG